MLFLTDMKFHGLKFSDILDFLFTIAPAVKCILPHIPKPLKFFQNRTEQNRTLFQFSISGHSQVAYEKKIAYKIQ